MSFVSNSYQQISLFDKLAFLSGRKQQMLEKSWAQAFSKHIFTRINEHIFAPLYSEKMNSRPNAPINVLVSALILKDFTSLTDDETLKTSAGFVANRDFTVSHFCLGSVHEHYLPLLVLNLLVDMNIFFVEMDVCHSKATELGDPQACAEKNIRHLIILGKLRVLFHNLITLRERMI